MHTSFHTFKTKVIVTPIADVAVIMLIKHVLFTVIAVHRPRIEKWSVSRDTMNECARLMSEGFWIRRHTLAKRGKSDVLGIVSNIAGNIAGSSAGATDSVVIVVAVKWHLEHIRNHLLQVLHLLSKVVSCLVFGRNLRRKNMAFRLSVDLGRL